MFKLLLSCSMLCASSFIVMSGQSSAQSDAAAPMQKSVNSVRVAVGKSARDAATPLLDQLKSAKDVVIAQDLEGRICEAWAVSDDPEIDRLMGQAQIYMQSRAPVYALAVLDTVIAKAPGFAEGWNVRATLFFVAKDYNRSFTDFVHVLTLEPRHFGALSGIGLILNRRGDKLGALAAYEQVLQVDPLNSGAKASVEALQGNPI